MDDIREMQTVKNYLCGTEKDTSSDPLFVYLNWEQITTEEAIAINPYLATWFEAYKERATSSEHLHFFRCLQLTADNKCSIHKDRPNVCINFPWYGRTPDDNMLFYSKDCGYIVDVPLKGEILPLTLNLLDNEKE